jgi:acetamidase/formamidase
LRFGIERRDAYAVCSMAVSFGVTTWADQTGSVYGSIPRRAIHAAIPNAVPGDVVPSSVDVSIPAGG